MTGIFKLDFDKYTIFSILDSTSKLQSTRFVGPLSPEKRASYFTLNGFLEPSINVYLLKGHGEYFLVDSGYGYDTSALLDSLKKLNVKVEDINNVLITHAHWDHLGGLIKENADTGICTSVFPNANVLFSHVEKENYVGNGSFRGLPDKVANAYGERLKTFEWEQELFPGLKAFDLSGHTAGHTGFELTSTTTPTKKIIFCGDFIHVITLQCEYPDEHLDLDTDPERGNVIRRALFERAVAENILLATAHAHTPGLVWITKNSHGVFEHQPFVQDK